VLKKAENNVLKKLNVKLLELEKEINELKK